MLRLGKGNLRTPKLTRPVYMVAGGLTDFRKCYPQKQTVEIAVDAARMAVIDNLNMEVREFKEHVNYCVYSHFADHFSDQLLEAALVNAGLGLEPMGNVEVKTGGATGGFAMLTGIMAIASGMASCVPIIGWERMDEVSTRQGNTYISFAADKNFETDLNRLYATYYGLMLTRYMHEISPARETLARIAQKNHYYARFSPYTQLPGDYTIEEIINDKIVSSPLTFKECCAMSVGAAVAILADEETAFSLTDHPVKILGAAGGTDTLRTADRRPMDINQYLLPHETPEIYAGRTSIYPGFTSFRAARFAAMLAYAMAEIKNPLEDLDLIETHDAFVVSDIQTYEDVGLRPYGRGAEFIESGDGFFEGRLPSNLSGGLIGGMHSVGATGIFQLVEIFWQIRNEWEKFHADKKYWKKFGKTQPENFKNLQLKNAKRGMGISHAGTGSHVSCIILEQGW